MATNNVIKVSSGKVPAGTLDKANSNAPAGKGGDLGGRIPGFGSGRPDGSTINGPTSADKLAAQPASSSGKAVKGFTGSGMKAGKI